MPVIKNTVKSNGIDIAYEVHGELDKPIILLIHGLSMSLVAWPPALLRALKNAGYTLILFDNRDMGLSQKMDELGLPNFALQVLKHKLRLPVKSTYQLEDMMHDALGLLDALEIDRVHVMGVSMGGMIAQLLAIHYPDRVKTLTMIMSTTGKRGLPGPRKQVVKHFLSKPESSSLDDRLAFAQKTWRLIGSPKYPMDSEVIEVFVKALLERGMPRVGTARQMLAVLAAKSRNRQLARLKIPSLVIHGKEDPLIPVECGIDIASSIPNCALELIDGMGHDLPSELIPQISQRIIKHMQKNN